MRLYHNTFPESAEAILASGFRNSVGCYLTPSRHRGALEE
jgi:hypothetical protein